MPGEAFIGMSERELLVTSCPGRPLLARCKAGFPF